jgi:hypothetical protein
MKDLVRAGTFACLSLASCLAASPRAHAVEERFRHLLNWSIDTAAEPSTSQSVPPGPSGFRRPRSRLERWSLLERWQWLASFADALHTAAGASSLESCSMSDRESLRDALDLLHAHLEAFETNCLPFENAAALCNDEESRLDEAESALSDLADALKGCQERPHFGRMRIHPGARPVVSANIGGSFKGISSQAPESNENRAFPYGRLKYFQAWGSDRDFALATRAEFVSGQSDARLGYDLSADASLDTGGSLFRFHVFGKGTQDEWLESNAGYEGFQNFGASLAFALPRAVFSYGATDFVTTDSAYSGLLHAVRAQGLISSSAESEQWVEARLQAFTQATRAVSPSWQAIGASYALQGLLQGGGRGELRVGLEERRTSQFFVRLMPILGVSFETARTPGLSWKSGNLSPSQNSMPSFVGRFEMYYRPFTSFYAAVAQELGVEPSLEWHYKRLSVKSGAEFRREEHLSAPSGRRRDWALGLELSPAYSLSSKLKLEGQLRLRQVVVQEAGIELSRVWTYPRLPHREIFAAAGLTYDF